MRNTPHVRYVPHMNPSETCSERLHVMVTPTEKRMIEEAAELRGFRSEGSVIRHLVDTHLPSLIQSGGKPAADYTGRTRLLVDTAATAPEIDDALEAERRVRPMKLDPIRIPRELVERHEPSMLDTIRAAAEDAARTAAFGRYDDEAHAAARREQSGGYGLHPKAFAFAEKHRDPEPVAVPREKISDERHAEMVEQLKPHFTRLHHEKTALRRRAPEFDLAVAIPHTWGDDWKYGGTILGMPIVLAEVEQPQVVCVDEHRL